MTSNRKARQYKGRTTNRRVEVEMEHMPSTDGVGSNPTDVATVGTTHVTMRLFDAEGLGSDGEPRRVFGGASFHNVTNVKVEDIALNTTKLVRLTFSTTFKDNGEQSGRYDVSLFGMTLSDLNDAVVAALLQQAVTA